MKSKWDWKAVYKKRKKQIIILIAVTVVLFFAGILFIVYWEFAKYPIPKTFNTRPDVEPKDWLQFWGSFLTFIGTVALGSVTVIQANYANKMNKRLVDFENNKMRPYVKINKENIVMAVSKDTMSLSDSFQRNKGDNSLYFEGNCRYESEKQDSGRVVYFYPLVMGFRFSMTNIGNSPISFIRFNRFSVLDGTIGKVESIRSSVDVDLMINETKQVNVCIHGKVAYYPDGRITNVYWDTYKKDLSSPLQMLQIEATIEYQDIYGGSYNQDISIHLDKIQWYSNIREQVYSCTVETEHHIGLSPYGPRIE